ncbi:unnamed protein product [Tilletia controversa]|uniref:DDT domain-containing protein n=3 Tax=Tilletia TaxID=13289 RepID=A0A8X7MQR4_9BASI|nr:hypothetical protein CF336_g5701 [Tilletia laevis]KAE8192711.1 hypothetical protein CF328_g5274 [Tilletia controversa]KAE8253466.1 hypothetical protein A4X03_0g5891 [Tilletia caries]KAE8196295.1 hypothetical protein CF335_g4892 [Tilletia laevis]KAE8243731.1 hypothetical protein A4X06_0g6129 [Tilletia controversa]
MVLLRRKQVELVKRPVQLEGHDPDVFYLAATGEIFPDYESYTTRLSFYNQRLFQCELTGRSGLTFFEALLSENQELARLVRDFPDILKGPVLKSANFAIVGRLDQLVDNIYERFHNRFFPGDEVSLEIEGDKYHAEIKEVYPPRSVWRIHQEEIVDSKIREYEMRRSASASPTKPKRSPAKAGPSKAATATAAAAASSSAAAAATAAAAPAKAEDYDSDLSDLTELPPASQDFLASLAESAALSLTAADVAHKIGGDLVIPAEKALKLDPPEDYLYRLQLRPGPQPATKNNGASTSTGTGTATGTGTNTGAATGGANDDDDNEAAPQLHPDDNNGEGSSSRPAKVSYAGFDYEARASALSRDRLKFSKTILKKLLREALRRDPHVGAPWKVREHWARVYGINVVPSEAVAKKHEEIREAKLQKRKKVVEEPVVEPPKKKKVSQKVSQAELKRKAAEGARLLKEKEEEEKRLKAERKKALKYPCEDLELDPINARELSAHVPGEVPRMRRRPACKRDLPGGLSGSVWEELLGVYGYLQAVGKPLQLSSFTLDDFEMALRHPTHDPQCTLVVEIHAAVLNTVIRDGSFSKELAPAALSMLAPQQQQLLQQVGGAEPGGVALGQRVASIKREGGVGAGGKAGEEAGRDSRATSVLNGQASSSRESSAVAGEMPSSLGTTRSSTSMGKKAAKGEVVEEDEDEELGMRSGMVPTPAPASAAALKSASVKLECATAAELAALNGASTSASGAAAGAGGRSNGAAGLRKSAANGHLAASSTNGGSLETYDGDRSFADTPAAGAASAGVGDILDISPEEQVLSNALYSGRGWEKRILKYDEGRRGWELALIGCLAKRATVASCPRLWSILSQLTGTDHIDGRTGPGRSFIADTYADEESRYPLLPIEDKVAALQFVCELSMMTKYVRSYFEECETTLTELRKERAEISRARKQVDEERRDYAVRELTRGNDGEEIEGDAVKTEAILGAPETAQEDPAASSGQPTRAKSGTPASEEENEDNDMLSEDELSSDDDAASTTSGRPSSAKRPRLASRQETLRKQAMEREAAEAAKEAERARAAQAKKDKNAEARQLAGEKKRLEEEHLRVTKREEAWEREFRKFQFGPRLKPLGYDRFYQRYWWFDGLGTAPLVNQAGNMVYSTGRIFVQGPSENEWAYLLAEIPEGEVKARLADELELEAEEEQMAGADAEAEEKPRRSLLLGENEWGYYDEPERVEELFAWLRVRGVREDKFKKEFAKWRSYIMGGMARRNENLSSNTRSEPVEGRRSVRSKTEASRQSHMVWTNKAAIK